MKITIPKGAVKNRRRLGRGAGSGTGCTAGKGTKGQKARSGKKIRPGFEGGQMPLYRRLPRRGFSNYLFKLYAEEVTLRDLNNSFDADSVISMESLYKKKLISRNASAVKVLKTGTIEKPLTIQPDILMTKAAQKSIVAAGGTIVADNNQSTTSSQIEEDKKDT